jgi:hypothetical protein
LASSNLAPQAVFIAAFAGVLNARSLLEIRTAVCANAALGSMSFRLLGTHVQQRSDPMNCRPIRCKRKLISARGG